MSKYVALQETNMAEAESWLYFIKYDGNEKELKRLAKILDSLDNHIIDDASCFDIDLEHMVSEQTAKEMTRIEVNTVFHRKFDGKLKRIDFDFDKDDDNEDRIIKVHEKIGLGTIDDFIDGEDDDEDDKNEDNTVDITLEQASMTDEKEDIDM